ncbi:unnamed protein product [Fraxinus pennsylvanica]|uniref:Exostosin GT47 domain-containing protein n=1 Tax=Fraxinus pennsylvanica TaxID=56036 RepID=A0AAD2A9J2_9LAMI|nr:unnamed protein product [Fraxinus pennsylvanica]
MELNNNLRSVKSHISLNHCAWLCITILLQVLIIVYLNRASPAPPSLSSIRHQFQAPAPDDQTCKYGRIYAYNLPVALNKELLENCRDLDPWSSRCNAVSNGGFGPRATGLDGVVPKNLSPAWYWTDMYAAEVIYHDRMLNYKCRTLNQEEATAYYIPFYVGLSVGKYLWFNYT